MSRWSEITRYDNALHDSLCSTCIVTDKNIFDTWSLQGDLLKLDLRIHYVASGLDTECSKLMLQSPFPEDIPKSHLYNDWSLLWMHCFLLLLSVVTPKKEDCFCLSVCLSVCVCLELGIYLLKTESHLYDHFLWSFNTVGQNPPDSLLGISNSSKKRLLWLLEGCTSNFQCLCNKI